jgi:uncharacterized protein
MTGCATYQEQNKFAVDYQHGNLARAEQESTQKADAKAHTHDAIIWQLEQATILRAAGKFAESNRAFELAEAKMDQYAKEARIKVAHEAAALLTTQANLPYVGRSYDGIMLNTYKALNYLQLNQVDQARVELNRAYERQKDAVADNQRRIARTQDELNQSKDKQRIEASRKDPKFNSEINSQYAALNRFAPYADYVNPFTVYLDGLFRLASGNDAADWEHARQSLVRTLAFVPDNPYVKADLQTAEELANKQPLKPTTYVIFETGRAPVREQIRIDIPIIFYDVSYVGAAFPKLVIEDDYLPGLVITASGVSAPTATVASMDRIIGAEFKNELPSIITKTLIATVGKAAAAYGINRTADHADDLAGWLARLGTMFYQAAVNIADLRTWTTLPKEFQIARVPTPPDRKIEFQGVRGGPKVSVTVGEGTINVVYVKNISITAPYLISQMKLK